MKNIKLSLDKVYNREPSQVTPQEIKFSAEFDTDDEIKEFKGTDHA